MSWKKPTEATGQKARFRDRGETGWDVTGELTAMGVNCHGDEYFLNGCMSWDECEVEETDWVVPDKVIREPVPARFRDEGATQWVTGELSAIGIDCNGKKFFVDDCRLAWDECEVEA